MRGAVVAHPNAACRIGQVRTSSRRKGVGSLFVLAAGPKKDSRPLFPVAEGDEMDPGGYVALNDDDDDNGGTADKDEAETVMVVGENDLVALHLAKTGPDGGEFELSVTNYDSGRIKVWEYSTRCDADANNDPDRVTLTKTWNAQEFSQLGDLYVEGDVASGSAMDVTLQLKWTLDGQTYTDTVNITVIDVQSIAVDNSDSKTHKIASVKDPSEVPDDHFVTAKGTGNIVLLATIVPDTAATRNAITWTGMTQDGANKLKATKPRTTSGEYSATVNVSGADARDLTNWVVWSTASSSANAIAEDVYATYTQIKGGYDVTHTITPGDIITQNDRPGLSGANSTDPPDVPSGDTDVANKGVDLSNGANKKWDSSRQVRRKILNPDGLNFNNYPGDIEFYTSRLNYPSDDVCGNDDGTTSDENNDPYNAPHQGSVFGEDEPSTASPHSEGNLNNTWEKRLHMRGFARLEICGTWYRISDWYLWKTHFKFKKQNESEATWGLDFNDDGDTNDTVPIWRDDGSSIALDNNGF